MIALGEIAAMTQAESHHTQEPTSAQAQSQDSMKAELSERDVRFREESLGGNMWKVILMVGAPLALYQSLQQIFTLLDTMMASHISATSVSAVAYLAQLITILSAFGNGLAVGAGILISRAYGEGDYHMVKRRVSTIYALALAASVLILACILPFVVPFLRFAGTPEELIDVGRSYFVVELFVVVATILNAIYISVERARGNSRRILRLNLIVIVVKLALTALFVYVLSGDLVMIAVASLVSQLLLLACALRNVFDRDNAFGFSAHAIALRREVIAPMITQSIPVMLEKALFAYGKTIINSMSTVYGALMVGALGVSNNLGGITTMPQDGFKDGASAVISQNYGAGKYRRVLQAFWCCAIIDMALGALISGLELRQLQWLSGLFAGGDETFHQMIADVYMFEALAAVPLGLNAAILALLYGLGKTRITLVLNFSRVFVFRIPVFWYLQNYTNLGDASCGWVMFLSNTFTAAFAAIVGGVVIWQYKRRYLSGEEAGE